MRREHRRAMALDKKKTRKKGSKKTEESTLEKEEAPEADPRPKDKLHTAEKRIRDLIADEATLNSLKGNGDLRQLMKNWITRMSEEVLNGIGKANQESPDANKDRELSSTHRQKGEPSRPTTRNISASQAVEVETEKQGIHLTEKTRSVWDSFDKSKLARADCNLEYTPPLCENGIEFCTIEEEDIQSEIEYWRNSVVVYVLGANPPYHVMSGYLHRIWRAKGIDKIVQVLQGVFVVRFQTTQ